MLRINYIARINPFSPGANGGGEHVMRALIGHGQSLHHIEVVTPETIDVYDEEADFNIFADVFNFPLVPGFLPVDLEHFMEKPYVHFNNAYVDLCVHDYNQCDEPENVCNVKGTELMLGAKLIYFVSPLHQKTCADRIPQILDRKTAILRPIVDTDAFRNAGQDRPIDYLYIAPLLPAKGFDNALEYLEQAEADPEACLFVGANPYRFPLGGIQHRDRIPYIDMPSTFNRAKVFVHLPEWKEPMGRTVIEAALCGCNLVLNENVGATSFGFEDLSNPDNYEGSVEEFWTVVESTMNHGG